MPVKKLPTMPLLYIEWQDASTMEHGWHSREDIETWIANCPMYVEEVGWLYKEDAKSITLLGSIAKENQTYTESYGRVINIPKTWIRKRITLVGKKEKNDKK
jgi:hypothetical protein